MRPINLLPPEAFARRRRRRLVLQAVLVAVAYLGLLAVLTPVWTGRVANARAALAAQEATNAELEGRIADLADAQRIADRYRQEADMVRGVLADDVSWGRLLNDLGRVIPDRVWLEGFSGTVDVGAAAGAAAGSIEVSGVGFDVPDVAEWLRALDSDRYPGVAGTWVSSITDDLIGDTPVVRFVSQAALTDAARSTRARTRVPEVGG